VALGFSLRGASAPQRRTFRGELQYSANSANRRIARNTVADFFFDFAQITALLQVF